MKDVRVPLGKIFLSEEGMKRADGNNYYYISARFVAEEFSGCRKMYGTYI